jgi:hypothetical protein
MDQAGTDVTTRHRSRALLLAATLVIAVGLLVPSMASAATLRRTFRATLGSGGYNGSATIWAFTAGNGFSRTTVQHLRPNTTYAVRIYANTCKVTGPIALTLPGLHTDATGKADRYLSLSTTQMNAIYKYVRVEPISIRFVSGTSKVCGNLTFPVVTRIAIPAYSINLAVVMPPGTGSTFPYCNVAEYIEALSQPDEPGVTMIYAHARAGMFLKLWNVSMINNGASMIGKTVRIYLSTDKLYTYKVAVVRRHQRSIQAAFGTWVPQVWLQTSEGYTAASTKLIVVLKLVSITRTTYAAAHPVPHRVICH